MGKRRLGYARVSTKEQSMSNQVQALEEAGCSEVFEDFAVSGRANEQGKVFVSMMDRAVQLREEGFEVEVIVSTLDRFSRSLSALVLQVERLAELGVSFRSLDGFVSDMNSPQAKLTLHLLGAFAEFERSLIRSRMEEGLEAKKSRGFLVGGKPKWRKSEVEAMKREYGLGKSIAQLCRDWNIPRTTLNRVLGRYGETYLTLDEWEEAKAKSEAS